MMCSVVLFTFYVLLLPPRIATASVLIPRHARLNGSSGWVCNAGYYRTTPTDPIAGVPTCRPCTSFSNASAAGCTTLWVPCTNTADARCDPCPWSSLPPGYAYVPGSGCRTTTCTDGYYYYGVDGNNNNNTCLTCPVGAYCPNGQLRPCGPECTTTTTGASSVLQCLSYNNHNNNNRTTWVFTVQATFFASALTEETPAACAPTLNAILQTWLLYGAYQGTTLTLAPPLGTLTYAVAVPSCAADPNNVDFMHWFLAQSSLHQEELFAVLVDCLQAPQLVLGAPLVQAAAGTAVALLRSNQAHNNNNTNLSTVQDAPPFVIQRRIWGQSRDELAFTLGVLAAMLLGLLLGIATACALACVRVRHRARVRRLLLFSRRKKNVGTV